MKRSPSPSAWCRQAFTLVELLAASTVTIIVAAGLYGIVQAGMTVGVRSLAINHTGNASRHALDRAEQLLQVAYTEPIPLQRNGHAQTDTTTPAAGVRFFRYIGGPYQVDIPSSGLRGNAESLSIFARTESNPDPKAPPPPPIPQPNDILVINTTILMSGRSSHIYAYVKGVSGSVNQTRTSAAGTDITGVLYTISLSQTLTDNEGYIPPDTHTITATLIRPTALIVVPKGDNRELRLYESYPETTNLDLTYKHSVLTDQVAWPRSSNGPSAVDSFATPFRLRKLGDRTFVNSNIHIRANRYDSYLRSNANRNEFSSFTELRSRVPVKCNPNE